MKNGYQLEVAWRNGRLAIRPSRKPNADK